MNEKEMVAITYSKPAKSVSVIGNFPSYSNKIKLNYNAQSDQHFSINLNLPPGKYHYKYNVDGIETVEYDSPIEVINGEKFNTIKIKDKYTESSQSLSKFKIEELIEIDQRIMTLEEESLLTRKPMEHPDPFPETGNLIPAKDNINIQIQSNSNNNTMKTKSVLLDFSNSFSMKIENTAHDYNNQMLQVQKDEREEKVIVYNIVDDFLIPMVIIKEGITDAHYAKFHYVDKNEDIIIHKNDVFYQPIDCFDVYGNFSDMKMINELALLKNMQMRILSNHHICFIKDIMLLFNKEESNKRKFFISEFIKNEDNNHNDHNKTIIYKHNFKCSADSVSDNRMVYDFFTDYIKLNYLALHQMFESLFKSLFSLFNIELRYVYHFAFDIKHNDSHQYHQHHNKGSIRYTFLPLFPSNCLSNILYEKNILLHHHTILSSSSSFLIDTNEAFATKNNYYDKEIAIELKNLEVNQSLSTQQIKDYFKEIHLTFLKDNTLILNEIYTLLIKINLKHLFTRCLKLVLIAHLAINYQTVFNSILSSLLHIDSMLIHNVKQKNLMFYSNIVILVLLNYINHLLSFQFKFNKNEATISSTIDNNDDNNLLLFFNSNIKEDDILINEVIRQRISASQSDLSSNINSITKFIQLYTNDNITQFDQSLSSYDIQMINIIENIYDLTFLKDLYKAKFKRMKLLEIFQLSSLNSIEHFGQFEFNAKSIRQIWLIDPGVNYADFFASQEKIVEFLQQTQIVEYASFYHINRSYFREYSYEKFFKFFLPILSDIDVTFNHKKISLYKTLISNFISDLMTFQGINEAYEVTDKEIKLNYKTFETMMLLLKNLIDEKALLIQKMYKGRAIYKLIYSLKQNSITIQRYYRSKLYNKMKRLSQDDLASFLINKYLHSDPIIIKLIINSQKRINDLLEENNRITLAIEEMNRLKTEANPNSSNIPNRSNILLGKHMTNVKSSKNFAFNQHQKEEIEQLKTKLDESRTKFKDLVVTIAQYENKMENFVKLINSNREVKEVLYRNGIKIN